MMARRSIVGTAAGPPFQDETAWPFVTCYVAAMRGRDAWPHIEAQRGLCASGPADTEYCGTCHPIRRQMNSKVERSSVTVLSIVVPAYDEVGTLGRVLEALSSVLPHVPKQ